MPPRIVVTGSKGPEITMGIYLKSPAGSLVRLGVILTPLLAALLIFSPFSDLGFLKFLSAAGQIPSQTPPSVFSRFKMLLPSKPAVLAALHLGATLGTCQSPVILADTNRDGIINSDDAVGRAFWTSSRGAIFLPNVGDSSNRCPNVDLQGNPLSNHELASCNDASGHLLLEPRFAAPLKTLPFDVADDAFARIYATPDGASSRVRLFLDDFPERANETSAWRFVDPEFSFNASQIRAGITLGIDGREFVKNVAIWDGKVTVRFDVHANSTTHSDVVQLKIAPVLTHHHLQSVTTLLSTAANASDPVQLEFLRQLDAGREAAGLAAPLYLFNQSSDIWAQDFIEPAYASMQGRDGPVSIRIMLRSAQRVGGFQPEGGRRGFGHLEINSFGNLETIPPYVSKSGIKYPVGRIIQGKHFEKLPAEAMTNFLNGQGIQKPLLLETGWLLIGHVDEFVQFVPSNKTGLGFTIAIADTTSALDVLRNASSAGHGDVRAVSFNGSVETAFSVSEEELATTVDQLLANATFHEVNAYAQRHIDANFELLLAEIPLAREDVIRVPVLFKDLNMGGGGFSRTDDGLPSHTDEVMRDERLVASFSPAAINGIVIGQHYLSPKPWGPVVGDVDLFEEAVRSAYGRAGMDVSFVDDFLSHHVGLGEIHCGSNTFRETDVKWWE
ncbi:Protein-arginine deiminase type-3 [Colletotrichum orbiculare MAFF 240422]|uniref:Protein-arginine deiminase type-3 n=1 Tax=Colletotrichum orbiculare (strain 104-T / ATCC 96160 / CBS 514.97 / LARS 414 / MAFF 240422) TaxID=1213857 RepID=A0A484FUU5_COLOR|nr:Protein-arginine deiminase type-3 [Colletotrichum orbiculare MAFF 240422]